MPLLDAVKKRLRISSFLNAYDDEVQDLIDEVKADLVAAGVDPAKIDETDPEIKRAIRTYCKANFGWNNSDADKFQKSYDSQKVKLSLSVDYIKKAVDD